MNYLKYSAVGGFLVFAVAVLAFLAQMWFHPWDVVSFIKIIHTFCVFLAAFFVGGFLARESGAPQGKVARRDVVRVTAAICFAVFVVGALSYLVQIWLEPWSGEMFGKIILTEGALFALVFGVNFLVREGRLSDSIRHGDKLE